jgi:hypothetical protein
MSGIDPSLLYAGALGLVALAGGVGYCINNRKAAAAIRFATSTLSSLQACDTAIRDGTVTPDEERNVGRATIQAYRDGGATLAALVQE